MDIYALGDIHNNLLALEQVLARSPFRPGTDRLVFLGDAVDGFAYTAYEVVEKLLSIPNAVFIQGNHDYWCSQWLGVTLGLEDKPAPPRGMSDYARAENQVPSHAWLQQGGDHTRFSYEGRNQEECLRHYNDFFRQQRPYFVDEDNNLYVHGGYLPGPMPIERQSPHDLMWDRHLWEKSWKAEGYNQCFIGHTSTEGTSLLPTCRGTNVWNLDQGAGWAGKLTLMNVKTNQFYQSDTVKELYPNIKRK